jgi:hypothetical protein
VDKWKPSKIRGVRRALACIGFAPVNSQQVEQEEMIQQRISNETCRQIEQPLDLGIATMSRSIRL